MNSIQLGRFLGWFSLGLGAAEMAAPGRMARSLGLPVSPAVVGLFRMREVGAGLAVLTCPGSPGPVWARVGGDALDTGADHDAFRTAVVSHMRAHGAEFELRAQLCTSLERMPVEDASVSWPEDESPYMAVARLMLPPQDAYSPAWQACFDDVLPDRTTATMAARLQQRPGIKAAARDRPTEYARAAMNMRSGALGLSVRRRAGTARDGRLAATRSGAGAGRASRCWRSRGRWAWRGRPRASSPVPKAFRPAFRVARRWTLLRCAPA